MKLSPDEVMRILPHRDPILLINTVEEIVPGEMVHAVFHADPAMDVFRGHFPGSPVFPGVYSIECMGQAATLMLLYRDDVFSSGAETPMRDDNPILQESGDFGSSNKKPLFCGVEHVRFSRRISPGDRLDIYAHLKETIADKDIFICSCEIMVQETKAVSGEVSIAMR